MSTLCAALRALHPPLLRLTPALSFASDNVSVDHSAPHTSSEVSSSADQTSFSQLAFPSSLLISLYLCPSKPCIYMPNRGFKFDDVIHRPPPSPRTVSPASILGCGVLHIDHCLNERC
eukprot:EG_transcript_20631